MRGGDWGKRFDWLFEVSESSISKISNHSQKNLDIILSQNSEEISKIQHKIMYNRNLFVKEEEILLQDALDAHSNMCCLELKGIRKKASGLVTQRKGKVKVFDKPW